MNKKSDADVSIAGPSKASNISSIEYTSSSDSSFVAPTAKKRRIQVFREAWLQNSAFKSWLKQTDDQRKAKCTACSKLLTAHKKNLDEHARSNNHIMNLQKNAEASISVCSNASTSSSDNENNSSSDSILFATAAKKRKTKPQVFREAWLKDPNFKSWLTQADDPHKAKCTACSKLLTAHKNNLDEHARSDSHIMNQQQNAGASISVLSNAATNSSDKENNSSTDVSIAGPSSAAATIIRPVKENDSSSDSTFVAPTAMKPKTTNTLHREQAFRKEWLKDPQFQLWLQETEDPHKANCTLCSKFIRARKCDLQQHAITDFHIMNIQQKAGAPISISSNAATRSIDTTSFAKPGNAAISSSGTVNDSSSVGALLIPVANKVRRQTSCQTWLKGPHFKTWLQPADDPHKAKGTVCLKYVIVGQSGLQNHANSKVNITNMVHQKEALTSTVKRTFADNVKVAEMTICIDAIEHGKGQCQVEEVPSTSSTSDAASTRTRRNGETPTTTCRIHPIVHDHRYARIPWSMWKKIVVQKKQIRALKRERHVDKQQIFRLKKQVISLKRIVNKSRRTRAPPEPGLKSSEAIADKNTENIKEKQQISTGSGNTT